jgi:hypothetical protein
MRLLLAATMTGHMLGAGVRRPLRQLYIVAVVTPHAVARDLTLSGRPSQ